jgi:hypothetical protein
VAGRAVRGRRVRLTGRLLDTRPSLPGPGCLCPPTAVGGWAGPAEGAPGPSGHASVNRSPFSAFSTSSVGGVNRSP